MAILSNFQVTGTGGDIEVTPPVQSGTLKYNGSSQSPTWTTYASDVITITNTAQTNAGSYNAVATLQSGYIWSNTLNNSPQNIPWKINKIDGTSSLSKTSVDVSLGDSDTITVTRSGDGAIVATSSDTSVATVSVSGTTVTITGISEGNATVSIGINAGTNYNAIPAKSVDVMVKYLPVYGVEWAGTSDSTMSRTDDALTLGNPNPAVNNGTGSSPFDNIMPWAGMVKSEDANAGTVVSIPKYYYKWTKTGDAMKLQIAPASNGAAWATNNGFLCSPAHADREDGQGERDVVYVGRYHCSSSNYKSTTGVKPKASLTRASFRTNIHNLGSTIWQYDFAMYWTIAMLYLVEFADWNSQKVIGYGCTKNGSDIENMGGTDAMQYHTGTNAVNRTTYGNIQYRWIEGLWDNGYDWCDGIYFSSANVYCIKNPANFSDNANGTLVGTRASSNDEIKSWFIPTVSGFEYALYPDTVFTDSSYSTYICDRALYIGTYSGNVLSVGGSVSHSQFSGLFYLLGSNRSDASSTNYGSRLMILP